MKIHGVTYRHPLRNIMDEGTASGAAADTKSFLFDGTSDYVSQVNTGLAYFGLNDSSPVPFMGPWTVSIWFKTSEESVYQWLWGIYNHDHQEWARILIGIDSSTYTAVYQTSYYAMEWDGVTGMGAGGAAGYIGQPDATSNNPLCDGAWHHIAVTAEGVASTGKIYLYVDGALAASGDQTSSVMNPDRIQRVSGFDFNDTLNFNGNVAQLTLIKSELSAANIATLYNSGNSADPSAFSPYQWYRFGDNASDTPTLVVDNGSSGVNLTGYGPPTIVTDAPP